MTTVTMTLILFVFFLKLAVLTYYWTERAIHGVLHAINDEAAMPREVR